MIPALVLTAIIFFLGVQPNYLVHWTQTTTNEMIAQLPHETSAIEQLAQGVTLP